MSYSHLLTKIININVNHCVISIIFTTSKPKGFINDYYLMILIKFYLGKLKLYELISKKKYLC